jgi:hypothetical protein
MHLQRIQVPDFRVLKDVDITFEKEFVPRIFPLGSLNGGGKSTLLQLIFVLLHCLVDSERKHFLKNLLQGFHLREGEEKRVLAIMDIFHLNKIIKIEFFALSQASILPSLKADDKSSAINDVYVNPLDPLDELFIKEEISRLEKQEIAKEEYSLKFESEKIKLHKLYEELDNLKRAREKMARFFKAKNYIHIVDYSANDNEYDTEPFFCHIDGMDTGKAESFLKELSQKVFLAAPATQMFIFLSKEYRFGAKNTQDGLKYYYKLENFI